MIQFFSKKLFIQGSIKNVLGSSDVAILMASRLDRDVLVRKLPK